MNVYKRKSSKPHISPFISDDEKWHCEFIRESDSIVQSGFGGTPKEAYTSCMNNVDSIARGNALLFRINNLYKSGIV